MFEQETEAYHYPKQINGKRTGNTICVLIVDGRIFVGEAVCSHKDQFSKKIGRTIAKGRAMESVQRFLEKKAAYAQRNSTDPS